MRQDFKPWNSRPGSGRGFRTGDSALVQEKSGPPRVASDRSEGSSTRRDGPGPI